MSDMLSALRLKPILEKSTEGTPDYFYGVLDGFSGSLWNELFPFRRDAAKAAKKLHGRVVIVAAKVLEDEEGEPIEPAN